MGRVHHRHYFVRIQKEGAESSWVGAPDFAVGMAKVVAEQEKRIDCMQAGGFVYKSVEPGIAVEEYKPAEKKVVVAARSPTLVYCLRLQADP